MALQNSTVKRPRISVDIPPELRRRLRLAAARQDQTVGQYVTEAIQARLRQDFGDLEADSLLSATTDPVLAALWDNPLDAEYDRL